MSRLKINERLIIRCYDHEQVKDVLEKLTELGYETKFHEENGNVICFENYKECFININAAALDEKSIVIWYKRFVKIFERQKEKLKKESDLIVDKNEKILKVNNKNKDYDVFYYDTDIEEINEVFRKGLYLAEAIKNTDFYTSFEACKKALKRKEIENKLRALAFELNGNKDIDWEQKDDLKYYIEYNVIDKETWLSWSREIKETAIYCYDRDFLQKATELIGDDDLKDYLINY